jgi:HPt (histidine-containing phosphotransfer) domain-containing protein
MSPKNEDQEISLLREDYRRQLPAKLSQILTEISKAGKTGDWGSVETLLHKLAGSSGTYGFLELSEASRSFELFLSSAEFKKFSHEKSAQAVARCYGTLEEQVQKITASRSAA